MLRCYLLALASGSSLDQTSRNFSLFNLVDTLTLPAEALGQTLPLELHAYLLVDQEAREQEFELRLLRESADGRLDPGDPLPFRTGAHQRFRLRIAAFRLPHEHGEYTLRVEWRFPGEDTWHSDVARWPLSLHAPPDNGALGPAVAGSS